MGKIFINYRRDDDPSAAARIRDGLSAKFGKSSIFMDVDNLVAGQRFDEELAKALSVCDILIAIIGPRWTSILNSRAQTSERDYVREEIARALERRIAVIPVRVGREGQLVPLPSAGDMPDDIRELVLHQKQDVTHERFGRDIAELTAAIATLRRARAKTRSWGKVIASGAAAAAIAVSLALGTPLLSNLRGGALDATVSGGSPTDKPSSNAVEGSASREAAERMRLAAEAEAKRKAEEEAGAERERQRLAAAAEDQRKRAAAVARRQIDDAEANRKAEDAATEKERWRQAELAETSPRTDAEGSAKAATTGEKARMKFGTRKLDDIEKEYQAVSSDVKAISARREELIANWRNEASAEPTPESKRALLEGKSQRGAIYMQQHESLARQQALLTSTANDLVGRFEKIRGHLASLNNAAATTEVYFATRSESLLPESYAVLDTLADAIKTSNLPTLTVAIQKDEGAAGQFDEQLSWKRAKSVVDYLESKGLGRFLQR